jgi:hypothetical protein
MMKNGREHKTGKQKYRCRSCGHETVNPLLTDRPVNGQPVSLASAPIITEQQLIAENDYNFIIQKALDQLQPGQYRDRESLLQVCKLKKNNDVYNALKSERFLRYQGMTRKDGKLVFGHPDRIKKLIEDTVLTEPTWA